MKTDIGKPLNVIKKIAAGQYTSFGIYLLQDEYGESVKLLKKDNNGAEEVTRSIIQQWLTNGGPNCTYSHFIDSLRAANFGCLVDEVSKIIEKSKYFYFITIQI